MLSFKTENYNVSIPQPWALMLNCCSHFLPHLDLPVAPSRHVNRTHMEKTETALSLFSSPVELHSSTFATSQNWTTPCCCRSTVHISSQNIEDLQWSIGLLCWKTDLSFNVFFPFFVCERGPVNHVLYTSGRGFTASPQGGRRAWWEKHDGISL